MKTIGNLALAICLAVVACGRLGAFQANPKSTPALDLRLVTASGLEMRVAAEHSDPALWLSLPNGASGRNAVLVLFPEHVTVRRRGTTEAQQLYLWRPGVRGDDTRWARVGNALQYE